MLIYFNLFEYVKIKTPLYIYNRYFYIIITLQRKIEK